jgi:hypothetical protein
MQRSISTIRDPESVPVRLHFRAGTHLSEDGWHNRIEQLTRELAKRLRGYKPPTEVALISQQPDFTRLQIGWVAPEDTNSVLDCIESVFPEVTAAHLGDEANCVSQKTAHVPEGGLRGEFVHVSERYVEFEDGRQVLVPPFHISRSLITIEQFNAFTKATSYVTTAERQGNYETYRSNCLIDGMKSEEVKASFVAFISKNDAIAYCDWAGTRLPTEEEWLAAFILDWTPRPRDTNIAAELKRRDEPFLISGKAEWTASVDERSGLSVVRTGPQYFVLSDWRTRIGRRLCTTEHYEIVISFRVVQDIASPVKN